MAATQRRFGTFEGVFTPCLLSIFGVIMYLRLGYVVGYAGLGDALIIIVLANLITIFTALSMSSVVTNIRIGAGGAYSIITKSLGLEAGGAIGIPLYLAQVISVAFYIAGFTECWAALFPQHNMLLVSVSAWAILFFVSYISTTMAFRIQYGIMALIGLSIVSILLGKGIPHTGVHVWEGASLKHFWSAFALFFPAVTGILAGASMSGELKEPRVSIPRGTLWAIGVSFCVYALLAVWLAKQAPPSVLRANTSIAIDLGRWRPLVVGGIMGATISSALAMFVSSPRVLQALGQNAVVPFSKSMTRINSRGEPAAAILLTAFLVLLTIALGTLNQIAGLLTMFFLITYGMINFVVFIEEAIGLTSFRPSFRVPRLIPLVGGVGCVAAMFLIDEKFSLIALVVIAGIYWFLLRHNAGAYSPDIRSGMLVFLAEQMVKAAGRLPYYPKIWKPNILIPLEDARWLPYLMPFVQAVVIPAGRVTILEVCAKPAGLSPRVGADAEEEAPRVKVKRELKALVEPLKEKNVFVETAVIEGRELLAATVTAMQTVQGMFFPPNTLLYMFGYDKRDDAKTQTVVHEATREGLGIIMLYYQPKAAFGSEMSVNLWIRRQSPNLDLSVLLALQLQRNWEGEVRLLQAVDREEEKKDSLLYLEKLKSLTRLPLEFGTEVLVGEFKSILPKAPRADIHIFGMQDDPDIPAMRAIAELIPSSCVFVRDSKHESALA